MSLALPFWSSFTGLTAALLRNWWVPPRLRRRGSPLLRRAIPLMDGRAESIYEGLLRMLHQVCGIRGEPQHAVLDSNGFVVARGDLASSARASSASTTGRTTSRALGSDAISSGLG